MLRITLGAEDRERLGAPEVMEYDPRKPKLREVRELKRQCGLTFLALLDALSGGDDLEIAGIVVWLALLRHDISVTWESLDLDFMSMTISPIEEEGDPNPSAPTGASTS